MIWLLACAPPPEPPPAPPVALAAPWLAVGDVRDYAAVFWAYAPGATEVVFTWTWAGGAGSSEPVRLPLSGDPIARYRPTHLPVGTPITVVASAKGPGGDATSKATFSTAPDLEATAPLSLVVGGDLGGQGYCRHPADGYAILDRIRERKPMLFLANGDLIYNDGVCPALAPDGAPNLPGDFASVKDVDWTDAAAVSATTRAHWRYNRGDPAFQRLLGEVPIVAQWDDHEVINDFGASWDRWTTGEPDRAGYPTLVREARAAFFDWSPIEARPGDPTRVYRSFPWGKQALLVIADARSYRSPNGAADGPAKAMLGEAQLDWLIDALTTSTATWKIVSLDVPLSVGTGDAFVPDAKTPGAVAERDRLLRALDDAGTTGVVVVATDVHWARIAELAPDPNGDGRPLRLREVISGPLRAWMGTPTPPDPALSPTVRFEAGDLPNFAWLAIDDAGALTVEIVGADGQPLPGATQRFTP